MHIRTTIRTACSADRAWRAMHSLRVAAALYRPLLRMRPDTPVPDGRLRPGDRVRATLSLLGLVPLGQQLIAVDDVTPGGGSDAPDSAARTMRDSGHPVSGPLALLTGWNHEMTVTPLAPDRAEWSEVLTIRGRWAPAMWPVLWTMWQLRARKLRRLSAAW